MAYSLDDLKADMDKRYGDFEVETPDGVVALRRSLRLPDAKQNDIQNRLKRLESLQESDDADITVADVRAELLAILKLAASDGARLDSLLGVIPEGDHTAALTTLLQEWQATTQPGEAGR